MRKTFTIILVKSYLSQVKCGWNIFSSVPSVIVLLNKDIYIYIVGFWLRFLNTLLCKVNSTTRKNLFSDFAYFACKACGKAYKWKASLRNHMKNECGKEPRFQCSVCVYKSKQKGNYIRHLATIHNIFRKRQKNYC